MVDSPETEAAQNESGHSAKTDALQKDIEQLRKDVAALTQSVKRRSNDQLQAGLNSAREHAGDWSHEIEARPYVSIFVAFGAGLLLGKLFSR